MNELKRMEHSGQRLLLTTQLAEAFGTDSQIIVNNFNRNRDRYTEGKHFIALEGEEKRVFCDLNQIDLGLKNAKLLYLWTEKGAWMHAKSLNTDQAWAAYEMLVDDYYRKASSSSIDVAQLSPALQMFHALFGSQAALELRVAEVESKALEAVSQARALKATVETIQTTFLQRDENWRHQMNTLLNGAVFRSGAEYREVRTRSYQVLEERAHCDLETRLRNLHQRLEEAGATKTQLSKTNKVDVIESDPRLKEIYATIVKELSIGSMGVPVK